MQPPADFCQTSGDRVLSFQAQASVKQLRFFSFFQSSEQEKGESKAIHCIPVSVSLGFLFRHTEWSSSVS